MQSTLIGSERCQRLWSWAKLAALTVFAIYFFVFMEWLFQVTKHSFMDFMPLWTRNGLLGLSGLFFSGASLLVLVLLGALSCIPRQTWDWKVYLWMGSAIPAFFIASTALLMLDNFTYTLFNFGIVTITGWVRAVYAVLFLMLLVGSFRWLIGTLSSQNHAAPVKSSLMIQVLSSAALLILSIPLGISLYGSTRTSSTLLNAPVAAKRPNILLIGSDGVNAEHMSLYGYPRSTTPFLESLAKNTLMSENNFPNASVTAGSLVSIFTGKLPTQNRVLYPPDILKGADAFEHFPGILKKEGYYTAEMSVDYFADADTLNLQDGFMQVNNHSTAIGWLYGSALKVIPQDAAYFTSTVAQRVLDRLLYIYFLRSIPNPFAEVTQLFNEYNDQERVDQTLSVFKNTQQPVFMHVHLMSTHVDIYAPLTHVFSAGEKLDSQNEMDFYDDSILTFDVYMRELTEGLAQMGKLDQTIIIVYTDHGMRNVLDKRLTLMIRFPEGEYAGKISHNTQNLDIAPTLLDYMGIPQPAWMTGQSLLKGEPPVNRPIFGAAPNYRAEDVHNRLALDLTKIKPPFYQFGTVGMVVCQKWYSLDTPTLGWKEENIENYPTPCPAETLPNTYQAQQMLVDQMRKDGFDVSTLRAAFKLTP
jgi:arylsulfatase A-like enzyme